MAKTKSGTQCGRWVTDGSMPAICHKHKPNAPAVGVIPPDDAIDPVKILQKLAKDANPQVRLRAVDLLLSLKPSQEVKSCTSEMAVDPKRLTPSERRRFEVVLRQFHAICEEVWTRDPQQRPESMPPPPEPAWDVDMAPPPPPAPAFVEPAAPVEEPEPEPGPFRLAEHLWPDVGLFKLKGAVTHVLGDAHAQAILDGSIPYDTARQQHADDQRHNHATFHRR